MRRHRMARARRVQAINKHFGQQLLKNGLRDEGRRKRKNSPAHFKGSVAWKVAKAAKPDQIASPKRKRALSKLLSLDDGRPDKKPCSDSDEQGSGLAKVWKGCQYENFFFCSMKLP